MEPPFNNDCSYKQNSKWYYSLFRLAILTATTIFVLSAGCTNQVHAFPVVTPSNHNIHRFRQRQPISLSSRLDQQSHRLFFRNVPSEETTSIHRQTTSKSPRNDPRPDENRRDSGPPPRRHPFKSFGGMATLMTTIVACSLFVINPNPAHAGFGPSGGATTSPTAGLLKSSVINVEELSSKKVQQLIRSSIDETRLKEFQIQLDSVVDSITQTIQTMQDEQEAADKELQVPNEKQFEYRQLIKQRSTTTVEEEVATTTSKISSSSSVDWKTIDERLEKAKSLGEQIRAREQLLNALEAQPLWFNYCAAFVGSVVSTFIMHPVDTIKTRLQAGTGTTTGTTTTTTTTSETDMTSTASSSSAAAAAAFANTTIVAYSHGGSSTAGTANHPLVRQKFVVELQSLYEGLTGNILKEGPPSALYLGVYETVKSNLIRTSFLGLGKSHLLLTYLIAGAVGEFLGSTVRAPAETIKSLVQTKTVSTTQDAMTITIFGEGRTNLLRSWSASIWRDVPFGAIQLTVFELVKAYILNNPNIDFDSSTLFAEAIIGAFAGGIGAFVTTPTDVITTRIITQQQYSQKEQKEGLTTLMADTEQSVGGTIIEEEYMPSSTAMVTTTSQEINGDNDNLLGVWDMGQLIHQEGGWKAFFVGWEARVLYWAPAISLFLTCYCSVRQLGIRWEWFLN